MKTGEPVESLSLSKILVLYMRKYQITLFMKVHKASFWIDMYVYVTLSGDARWIQLAH